MTDGIAVALIVALSSTIGPMLMAWLTNRHLRKQKIEDYRRQDEVARKAEEVAVRVASNARAMQLAGERQEKFAVITQGKLDVIHALVNSSMTAAMQAELDATVRELAMMREVILLNRIAGKEPSVDALAAVELTATRISELATALSDRLKAGKVAAEVALKAAEDLKLHDAPWS